MFGVQLVRSDFASESEGTVVRVIPETIEFCNQHGIMIKFETVPFCMMAGYERHVQDLSLSERKGKQLKEIGKDPLDWDKKRKEIKRKFGKCKRCRYCDQCEGPWEEYVDKFGDEEFNPVE